MRQDQFEKLQALTEKLTDVFLTEAEPSTWPGASVASTSWDQQTRGDRYWMKRNAAATLTVIMKTVHLAGVIQQRSVGGGNDPAAVSDEKPEEDSLDAEIKAAEKEASKLMNQALKNAQKSAFDKKAHGKA